MNLIFDITQTQDEKLARLLEMAEGLPNRALAAVVRALAAASQIIVGKAVKERFTGKGPFPVSQHKLGVRTGRLRRSIRATKPQANLRTGEVAVGYGSNVVYFKIHEFGFKGQVQVRQHMRRTTSAGKIFQRGRLTQHGSADAKVTKAGAKILKARLNAKLSGDTGGKTHVQVRQHKRRVDVKARKPLGTQLEHISTRAEHVRQLKRQLEPLLRNGK